MEDIASKILIALFTGVISAWLTAQLALRRFRSEKWWERRAQAYERAIESLHHRMAVLSEYFDQVELHKEISQERHAELSRLSKGARFEIDRAADIGSLYFSDEASKRLVCYRKEIRAAERIADGFDSMMAEWKATESCLSVLIKAAQKDLRLDKPKR